MQLFEGAKISQQILRQAINDPDFTFGIEAEFFLEGANAYMQKYMTQGLEDNGEHYVKSLRDTTWHDVTHFFKPLGVKQQDNRNAEVVMQERLEDFYRENIGREKLGAPSKLWDALKEHLTVPVLMAALRIFPDGRLQDLPENQEKVFHDIVYDGDTDEIKPFGKLGDVKYATAPTKPAGIGGGGFTMYNNATVSAFYELVADDLSAQLDTEVVSVWDSGQVFHVGDYQTWVVTSDSSLDEEMEAHYAKGIDTCGVEVVSSVMDATEGLAMLDRMLEIMNGTILGLDVTTTQNTGLHINLGVKDKDIDPVKILVLSGDKHMLEKFNRADSMYAASVQDSLKDRMTTVAQGNVPAGVDASRYGSSKDVNELIKRAQEALRGIETDQRDIDQVIAVLNNLKPEGKVHSIDFSKLPSGYVEYRALGNAGYEKRRGEIRDAVLHMIGMTYVATEPSAYRQEFLKKLYLMVQRSVAQADAQQDVPIAASVGMIGHGPRGGYGVPAENSEPTPYDGENFMTKFGFDSGSDTQ